MPILSEDIRLAFYLIPPYELCSEILKMRQIVQDQYQINAALKFMIHMTMKGFFKPVSEIDKANLIKDLDELVSKYRQFEIYPDGLNIFNPDHALVVGFSRERNETLWQINEDCHISIEPYIAGDCDFTPRERNGFNPHITVSMVDASLETLQDVKNYLSDAMLISHGYKVKDLKLYEFKSKAWHTTEWIYSLNWQILHSWRLES